MILLKIGRDRPEDICIFKIAIKFFGKYVEYKRNSVNANVQAAHPGADLREYNRGYLQFVE